MANLTPETSKKHDEIAKKSLNVYPGVLNPRLSCPYALKLRHTGRLVTIQHRLNLVGSFQEYIDNVSIELAKRPQHHKRANRQQSSGNPKRE